MAWKDIIIEALNLLGGEAYLNEIYNSIEARSAHELRNAWKATVRGTLERFSSDSEAYQGGEDLFYSVQGIGNGKWGLNNYEASAATMDLTQDDSEFSEGRAALKKHIVRERNHKLIDLAKNRRLEQCGCLKCEVCGFDFFETYGALGERFMEAHHTKPVSQMGEGERTKVEDIALLCSNCHSMIHRGKTWLTIEKLKGLISK